MPASSEVMDVTPGAGVTLSLVNENGSSSQRVAIRKQRVRVVFDLEPTASDNTAASIVGRVIDSSVAGYVSLARVDDGTSTIESITLQTNATTLTGLNFIVKKRTANSTVQAKDTAFSLKPDDEVSLIIDIPTIEEVGLTGAKFKVATLIPSAPISLRRGDDIFLMATTKTFPAAPVAKLILNLAYD